MLDSMMASRSYLHHLDLQFPMAPVLSNADQLNTGREGLPEDQG